MVHARFNSFSRITPWATALVLCFCGMCFVLLGCSKSYAVNRLIGDLRDPDPNTRWEAAKALGKSMDPRAVEPLIAALKDQEISVRGAAETSLGMIRDPRAVKPLIDALIKNPEGSAAKALEGIGIPTVSPLIATLKNAYKTEFPNKLIPKIEETLAGIGMPAVEPLIAALKDSDVRCNAASILGKIRDPRAVQPLANELKVPDLYFLRQVAWALGEIKDHAAVDPLMAALMQEKSGKVCGDLGQALGKIGAPAVDPLIAALKGKDKDKRSRAAMALGTSDDPRAIDALDAALKEHDLVVVAGAYFFFRKRGGAPNAVLIEALNAHGSIEMAEYFMNSRDPVLEKAAKEWASKKGYLMIPTFR